MNRILAATTISILSITSPAFADKKLKIFILAGQSNMLGLGSLGRSKVSHKVAVTKVINASAGLGEHHNLELWI